MVVDLLLVATITLETLVVTRSLVLSGVVRSSCLELLRCGGELVPGPKLVSTFSEECGFQVAGELGTPEDAVGDPGTVGFEGCEGFMKVLVSTVATVVRSCTGVVPVVRSVLEAIGGGRGSFMA